MKKQKKREKVNQYEINEPPKENYKKEKSVLEKECSTKKTKKKFDKTKSVLNGILDQEVMDALSELQIKDLERGYYAVQKYLN